MDAQKDLFQTRNKILELNKELTDIEDICQTQSSRNRRKQIDIIHNEIENLKIRRFVLQNLCESCLFV